MSLRKVECIIRSERFEELKQRLLSLGIGGMTISDVRGFGRQTSRPDSYLILPKLKVEVYCRAHETDAIVDAIIQACRKNELGDGKIAIYPLENIIRVRTGEELENAIY